MANAVTDSLLKAMNIIADNNKSSGDKTIKAIITGKIAADIYTASYDGGTIEVHSNSEYSEKETVYVLVPMGDFGNKKYIIGSAADGEIIQESDEAEKDVKILSDYNLVGANAISFIEEKAKEIILKPYKGSDVIDVYKVGDTLYYSIDEDSLSRNMSKASNFLIRAKFTTDLGTRATGNYGITITVKVKNTEDESYLIPFTLDTAKMQGDPMRYVRGMTQHMICNLNGYTFDSVESINCFCSGFFYQEEKHLIKISDIELYALDTANRTSDDFILSLSTPLGNTITEKNSSVVLTARVLNYGNEVTESSTLYWGIQDYTVTSQSEDYNSYLGTGFKYLSDFDNQSFVYVGELNCQGKENLFKCAALCGENTLVDGEVIVYNTNSTYEITIKPVNADADGIYYPLNGTVTLICLINGKEKDFISTANDWEFSFSWTRNGGELYPTTSVSKNTIKVPPVDGLYYCTVKFNNVVIGDAKIDLRRSQSNLSSQSYITIENGNQFFQYDEKGISPASVRCKEPIEILLPAIQFRNPNGGEIINVDDYCYWEFPRENSLIVAPQNNITEEGWYHGNTFPLSILETYDDTKTNNQLIAIVRYEGNLYRASTNLGFSKIGEAGTNGTSYSAKIVPEVDLGKDVKLALINQSGVWRWGADGKPLIGDERLTSPFKSKLYLNGQPQDKYSTSWSLLGAGTIGKTYSIDSSTGEISIEENNDYRDFRTIKANNVLDGIHYYSYYNLPSIQYYNNFNYNEIPIDIIDSETLNYVTYDADNGNPSYNTNIGVTLEMNSSTLKSSIFRFYAESGPLSSEGYLQPNFKLSFNKDSDGGNFSLTFNDTEDVVNKHLEAIRMIAEDSLEKEELDAINDGFKAIFGQGLSTQVLINYLTEYVTEVENKYYDRDNETWTDISVGDIVSHYNQWISEISSEYNEIVTANSLLQSARSEIGGVFNVGSWSSLSLSENQKSIFANKNIYRGNSFVSTYNELLQPRDIDNLTFYDKSNKEIIIEDYDNADSKQVWVQQQVFETLFGEEGLFTLGLGRVINGTMSVNISQSVRFQDVFSKQKNYYSSHLTAFKKTIADNQEIKESTKISDFIEGINSLVKEGYNRFLNNDESFSVDESQISSIAIEDKEEEKSRIKAYIIPNKVYSPNYLNNNVRVEIFQQDKTKIAEVVVPICFLTNTHSLKSLNDWDGTGIKINEDEGYILSPQIGAGIKNSNDNTFTGIAIGSLTNSNTEGNYTDEKIGLMGFSGGKQSIFLDANTGSATFGLKDGTDSDGWIELVPNGISKIANWNIGKNLLFSDESGTLETRTDTDARIGSKQKPMIPSNDSGILLSSNMPYIHIKGKKFDEDYIGNLSSRSFKNLETIGVGDSLELRLDPDDKSLFSIWQYSDSFNVEKNGEDAVATHYGVYYANDAQKKVSSFELSDKTLDESKVYVTYILPEDEEGNNLPYYTTGNNLMQYSSSNIYTVEPYTNEEAFSNWVIPELDGEFSSRLNGTIQVNIGSSETYSWLVEDTIATDGYTERLVETDGTLTLDLKDISYSADPGTTGERTLYEFESNENAIHAGLTYTDSEKELYSFTLISELKNLSINQPIEFSGALADDDLYWKFLLRNNQKNLVAETQEFHYGELNNDQIEFNLVDNREVYPQEELTVCLAVRRIRKEYLCRGAIIAMIKASRGFLPYIESKPLYTDTIGSYVQMGTNTKKIIVNSEIEFSYSNGYHFTDVTQGYGGYCYTFRNESPGDKKYSIVLYGVRERGGTLRTISIKQDISEKETYYFMIGDNANLDFTWYYAVYDYLENVGANPEISNEPQYDLEKVELKLFDKECLKINLGQPSNFNNLIPVNQKMLYCSMDTGDYQGLPMAVTTWDGENIKVSIDKDNITTEKWGLKEDYLPYIDCIKNNQNEYVKCVRALKLSVIRNETFDEDGMLTFNPRDKKSEQYFAADEYIKVGIDENGKFFTNGKNATSHRVGPVGIFDSYYGYGQEIVAGDKDGLGSPMFRVASNMKETTYITAGDNNKLIAVGDEEISLYVTNSLWNRSVQNRIPSKYTGITIGKDNLDLWVKGSQISLDNQNLMDIQQKLSSERLKKENEVFENNEGIIYKKLITLLSKLDSGQIQQLIQLVEHYDIINNGRW